MMDVVFRGGGCKATVEEGGDGDSQRWQVSENDRAQDV